MELESIFHEWEHGPAVKQPEGYINPAAMDAWAADSIEMRAERTGAAFE